MNTKISVERIENSFSSTYHCWLFYTAADIPGTLFETLQRQLPHIPSNEIADRTAWGGVFVNGLEVNANGKLPVPCKLEYYEPRFDIQAAAKYFPQFSTDLIIFEDAHLLALFKPAKLPTNPGKEQKYYNVRAYAEAYTKSKVHLPSRLDMSTCGLILLSKDPSCHKSLQRLFEYNLIKKTYLAGTSGIFPWEQYCHSGAIGRDPRHAVLRKVVSDGGKPAETIFSRVWSGTHPLSDMECSFVKAEPLTGRTHQIRVHSADLGQPIIGDNFYAGEPSPALHLMAYSVQFRHPKGGAEVRITVPERLFPEWLPSGLISS